MVPSHICPSDVFPNGPVIQYPANSNYYFSAASYRPSSTAIAYDSSPNRDGVICNNVDVRITEHYTTAHRTQILFGETSNATDPYWASVWSSMGIGGATASWMPCFTTGYSSSTFYPLSAPMLPPSAGGTGIDLYYYSIYVTYGRWFGFVSNHGREANFALSDGSVRFISDTVNSNSRSDAGPWDREEVVDASHWPTSIGGNRPRVRGRVLQLQPGAGIPVSLSSVVTRGGKPVAGLGIIFFPEGRPRHDGVDDASGR